MNTNSNSNKNAPFSVQVEDLDSDYFFDDTDDGEGQGKPEGLQLQVRMVQPPAGKTTLALTEPALDDDPTASINKRQRALTSQAFRMLESRRCCCHCGSTSDKAKLIYMHIFHGSSAREAIVYVAFGCEGKERCLKAMRHAIDSALVVAKTNVRTLCSACEKELLLQPLQCSRCKVAKYCNVECQRKHWKAEKNGHKEECKPFDIV